MSHATPRKPKPRHRAHGPHFDGRRFRNPAGRAGNGFLHFLRWVTTSKRARWPKRLDDRVAPQILTTPRPDQIAATFIGHSTFLLQVGGLNLLTDPVFSERVGPWNFGGPRRVRPSPLPRPKQPRLGPR